MPLLDSIQGRREIELVHENTYLGESKRGSIEEI